MEKRMLLFGGIAGAVLLMTCVFLLFYKNGHSNRSRLSLFLHSGTIIENPSDEELAQSLPKEETGVISESSDSMTYLQFAERKVTPWGLVLEYQVESLENHFETEGDPPRMEAIIRAFQKYAKGDRSWKDDFRWKQMNLNLK